MKKRHLTLLLAIALMITSVKGADFVVCGADLSSEELTDVDSAEENETELLEGTAEIAESDALTENGSQMADETPESKNNIVEIALIKKEYYDVFTFLDGNPDTKITYEDGTTEIKNIDKDTKYNDKYGNTYYYSLSREKAADDKGWIYVFCYYVTDTEGNEKTFTDSIQVNGLTEMPQAEINKEYQIKREVRYTFIPPTTAEYTITYTGDSNMWFWEVNEWETGRYSLGFVDREKNDYGSYKVVKSKLEKGKTYVITTVNDNSFYVSSLESEQPNIALSEDDTILTAAFPGNNDAVSEGIIYSADENPTIDTQGRTRITFTETSNDEVTFDASGLEGNTFRAYMIIKDDGGIDRVFYSDPVKIAD